MCNVSSFVSKGMNTKKKGNTMKRIMAVDDDEEIIQMIREALGSQGYEVETALSGKECLEKVGTFKPDMILLDIMMPVMDGWAVLEELDKMGIAKTIHIAMLTAKPLSEEDTKRGAFDHLVHYIRKPFHFPVLFQEIDRIVHEEKVVEEEAEEISKSFCKEFATAYQDFFKKASRQKRIFSHIVRNKLPEDLPNEEERAKQFMLAIKRMEKEIEEMKAALKKTREP